MRYIVGYTPDSRGEDALALAASLARNPGAELELVHVLDGPEPGEASSGPESTVQQIRAGRAESWLNEAVESFPHDVPVSTQVRYAPSFAEGLIEAAEEAAAKLIVVGAARNGLFGYFTVGSVASALLHASTVPLALVPSGYHAPESIGRITCAIGTRPGAEALFDVAIDAASRRRIPLRLISLLALDAHDDDEGQRAAEQAGAHAQHVLEQAGEKSDGRLQLSAKVARGKSIEDAIEDLEWNDDEMVLIGSSRLAQRRQLFLGATANKMLRSLPVPMVVVPRDYVSLDD
ncbi:universal stress protein [Arthrobacter castelli]|uniref:universal stress protein n=1 Tax=Arthrobacter castelli TaxID=271431 RepID=UPI00041228AA|nr:universal stress protein [Arthrobacter castelli]